MSQAPWQKEKQALAGRDIVFSPPSRLHMKVCITKMTLSEDNKHVLQTQSPSTHRHIHLPLPKDQSTRRSPYIVLEGCLIFKFNRNDTIVQHDLKGHSSTLLSSRHGYLALTGHNSCQHAMTWIDWKSISAASHERLGAEIVGFTIAAQGLHTAAVIDLQGSSVYSFPDLASLINLSISHFHLYTGPRLLDKDGKHLHQNGPFTKMSFLRDEVIMGQSGIMKVSLFSSENALRLPFPILMALPSSNKVLAGNVLTLTNFYVFVVSQSYDRGFYLNGQWILRFAY